MRTRFLEDILINAHNRALLARWAAFDLPDAWLVAGCLFQTVWNVQSGRPPERDIADYDLFYFDATDRSAEGEVQRQAHVSALTDDLGIRVEATNQARVHLWYEAYFGFPYPPLRSACDGIDRFLIQGTCVGVRPLGAASLELYAPYGLNALYAGTLTPNPRTPHRPLFDAKAASYQARWPWLRIVDTSVTPLEADPVPKAPPGDA